ncbi:putative oxidoreductase YciK [compost metagenome]
MFYPGAVRTAMRAKAMPGENPDTLPKPSDIAPRLIDLIGPAVKESGKLFNIETGAFEDI